MLNYIKPFKSERQVHRYFEIDIRTKIYSIRASSYFNVTLEYY